jgi:hypothetical protein
MKRNFYVLFAAVLTLWAVRLPGGEGPKPTEAAPVSAQTNERIKAAEAIARERTRYQDEHGGVEDETYWQYCAKFRKAMQEAAPAFELVEPLPPSASSRFIKFTFNQRGLGLDGFRFKNSSTESKNLGWVFAYARPSTLFEWYIEPVEGEMQGFRNFWRTSGDYADAPWKLSTNTVYAIAQSLPGAGLLPGKNYVIWFRFRGDKPEDVYVKFDLFPAEVPMEGQFQIERALKLR